MAQGVQDSFESKNKRVSIKDMKLCSALFRFAVVAILLQPVLATGEPAWETDCGNPYDSSGYGPYDINDKSIPREKIDIVLRYHFTPWMQDIALHGSTTRPPKARGDKPGRLHKDLDYTLRALPNHATALNAAGVYQLRLRKNSVSNYQRMLQREKAAGNIKTAECYFKRAIMFRPDDGMVRMAYGVFRHRQGKKDLALENYKEAVRLMPDSPEPHYNIGLLYIELEEFQLAKEHAIRAYELGYPLPGLRNALAKRGEWDDVETASVPSSD